jgi:hypothetical protein
LQKNNNLTAVSICHALFGGGGHRQSDAGVFDVHGLSRLKIQRLMD